MGRRKIGLCHDECLERLHDVIRDTFPLHAAVHDGCCDGDVNADDNMTNEQEVRLTCAIGGRIVQAGLSAKDGTLAGPRLNYLLSARAPNSRG